MELLLSFAGFIIVIATILFVSGLRKILGLRLKMPSIGLRPCEDIPSYLNDLFEPAEKRLAALGFQRLGCVYRDQFISHSLSGKWAVLLGNEEASSYAELTFNTVQAEMPGYEVSFSTLYSDGTLLQTVNCRMHGIVVDIPKVIFEDPYAVTLEEHWKAHLKRSAEIEKSKIPFPIYPELFVESQSDAGTGHIEALLAKGFISPDGRGEYKFRTSRALQVTLRLIAGQQKSARIIQARKKSDPPAAVPVEAEAEAYARVESLNKRQQMGRMGKTLALLVSAMFFSLSFGISLSFLNIIFLLGVVLFHELGHFLGMYIFGYRDLQILFVPFLGAVAYGREEAQTKPYQRIIVLLLGPLPGIVAGFSGMILSSRYNMPWLSDLSVLMLVLNFFNLIPLMPLDGGQVVQTLLFRKFPRLQTVFYILSAVLFFLLAAKTKESVLVVISAIMLMAIPFQWRQGSALAMMKKKLRGQLPDEVARISSFFGVLREKPFGTLPFQKKLAIVKVADREFRTEPASWKLIFVTLLVYGITVISPVGMLFFGARMKPPAYAGRQATPLLPEWDKKISQANTAEKKYVVFMEAGDWYRDSEDLVSAKKYYRGAFDLAGVFGSDDPRTVKSALALGSTVQGEEARRIYESALQLQERQLGPFHPDIAETLRNIAYASGPAEGLPFLERSLSITAKNKGEESVEAARVLRELVPMYHMAEKDEDGEKTAGRALDILRRDPANAGEYADALREFGIYYAVLGNFGEAERLLREGLKHTPPGGDRLAAYKEELGWVCILNGKTDEATGTLKEALELRRTNLKKLSSRNETGFFEILLGKIIIYASGQRPGKFFSEKTGASMRDIPLLLDIAYAYSRENRKEEAVKYFNEAMQIRKDFGRGRSQLFGSGAAADFVGKGKPHYLNAWMMLKTKAREEVKTTFMAQRR